jgi:hypothetical protein
LTYNAGESADDDIFGDLSDRFAEKNGEGFSEFSNEFTHDPVEELIDQPAWADTAFELDNTAVANGLEDDYDLNFGFSSELESDSESDLAFDFEDKSDDLDDLIVEEAAAESDFSASGTEAEQRLDEEFSSDDLSFELSAEDALLSEELLADELSGDEVLENDSLLDLSTEDALLEDALEIHPSSDANHSDVNHEAISEQEIVTVDLPRDGFSVIELEEEAPLAESLDESATDEYEEQNTAPAKDQLERSQAEYLERLLADNPLADDPFEPLQKEAEADKSDRFESDLADNLANDLEDDELFDESSDESLSESYEDESYEDESYEDESYEDESYEDDSAYYLEGEGTADLQDESYEDVALIDEGEVQRQRDQWQQQTRGNPWIFVGALGFVAVGLTGFGLTRPCTFGQCDRLQSAQAQGDEALEKLSSDTSFKAVTESKAQLNRSVSLLEPIPFWSRYYAQAQAILPAYRSQASELDLVSEAQAVAYQAALDSQNPPHSVAKWQSIASQWRAAADALEKVPAQSPVYDLARQKLVEYRSNLSTVKVRIEAESKAEVSLRQAQQASGLGQTRAETAGSLQDWEDALASWELAVSNLKQILQGTNAYGEAQKLLPEYEEELERVRDRTQQERSASQDLNRAKQLAAEAQRVGTEDQWTLSVQNWSAAVNQLKDIAEGTLAHSEAQAMLGLYNSSLIKAQNNQQVALRFQPIEPSFFAACGVTDAQKCTYSVRGGNVRLDLFQGYDRVIDQSITPPDQRQAIAPQTAQLIDQSHQLLQQVAMLSTQAQVPVALYSAEGKFLARYQPDLNGFVRQEEQTSAAVQQVIQTNGIQTDGIQTDGIQTGSIQTGG